MTFYDQLCDIRLLKRVWEAIYKGKTVQKRKTSKGIDNMTLEGFKRNENKYLQEILLALKSERYQFSSTKISALPKPDGGIRMIAMQIIKDRIVQKAILSIINKSLYPHLNNGVSYSGVRENYWDKRKKALNRIDAIKKLVEQIEKKNFWIFETDIESFFDKIPKDKMLERLFKILSPDNSLNKILKSVVNFEIANPEIYEKNQKKIPDQKLGVPQGSSLSPILANLYLFEFDIYMKKRFEDHYIRYADDLLVVCKSELKAKEAKKRTKYKINREKLNLKKDKTDILNIPKTPLIFLGVKLDRNGITTKKTYGEIVKYWDSNLLNIKNYKICYRNGREISKMEQINEKIIGWAYGYSHFHTENLFTKLDKYLDQKEKDKNKRLKGLKRINGSIKHKPIIDIAKWQAIFKRTVT